MVTKPYLIFSLHDTRYAIAAELVAEIFLLPELIPVADAPPDILGLLNFHNLYVPVMHLDLRFGRQINRCSVTDSVIVVESQGLQIGVIVHQVETVIDIDDRYIQGDLDYGRKKQINQAFVQGVINLDDEMIILLNVDNLIRHPDTLTELVDLEDAEVELKESDKDFYESYFPQASSKTKELLSIRAANLTAATEAGESSDLISIAIVRLNGDYFGLDLSIVREFTHIGRTTTIPCCPDYVVGNMNLRGEILTLIDIRQPLSLEIDRSQSPAKAIVIEVDGIIAGIVVEEVVDVVDLHPEELKPVPVAIEQNIAQYLKGIVDYGESSLNFIDLSQLLTQGSMTVELTA